MSLIEVKVPDIGDFDAVEIIEILVAEGDSVSENQDIITLESDKAAMEIPSSAAGIIKSINVKVGDKVAQGDVILSVESEADSAAEEKPEAPKAETAQPEPAETEKAAEKPKAAAVTKSEVPTDADMHAEIVVLGSGPGGYTAAFRAADLGKQVILIERHQRIGGVCLNVGCIPSKALLHTAHVINEAKHIAENGVTFGEPKIDIRKVADWKDGIVGKLTGGLSALAKQRKVTVVHGEAQFSGTNLMQVKTEDGDKTISFENCIIAAGSRVTKIPVFPNDDPRMMDSTDALELEDIPKKLLVIGGGIIGLEMATVYNALGSEISVVELQDSLIPGADKDLVKPLHNHIQKQYKAIYLKTKVSKIDALKSGLKVTFEGDNAPDPQTYDKILVAVGRSPNGKLINAEAAGWM